MAKYYRHVVSQTDKRYAKMLKDINRIVNYFSRWPQVQERLTVQIAEYFKNALGTENVAVIINAEHLCISSRGVGDAGCTTITSSYYGLFSDGEKKK
jgi:GTP cyclohydrolase I